MDATPLTAMMDKTFAFAFKRTYSRAEAEELTQEIMFQAVRSLPDLRDEARLEPWFWQLAHNTLKAFRRSQAKARACCSFDALKIELPQEDEALQTLEKDQETQALRRQVAGLSASYRDIVVMYYYDNLTTKAIAHTLGLPEGTMTYRLSVARDKLKKGSDTMLESVLKPTMMNIGISGEGDYNGESRPFPSQYIEDALSQNILWHAYQEPKTVEQLSELTGVPAYYVEDCLANLTKREAILTRRNAVQTDFPIHNGEDAAYDDKCAEALCAGQNDGIYRALQVFVAKGGLEGLDTAGREPDELLCLCALLSLDHWLGRTGIVFGEHPQRYDDFCWSYYCSIASAQPRKTRLGIQQNLNTGEHLSHIMYSFGPFPHRNMLDSTRLAVCQRLSAHQSTEADREEIAHLIAKGYLRSDAQSHAVLNVPLWQQAQVEAVRTQMTDCLAAAIPDFAQAAQQYLASYALLYPVHVREAIQAQHANLTAGLFACVLQGLMQDGRLTVRDGVVCDVMVGA